MFMQDFCQSHDQITDYFIFNRFKCISQLKYLVFKHFMKLKIDHLTLLTMLNYSSRLIIFHCFTKFNTFFKKRNQLAIIHFYLYFTLHYFFKSIANFIISLFLANLNQMFHYQQNSFFIQYNFGQIIITKIFYCCFNEQNSYIHCFHSFNLLKDALSLTFIICLHLCVVNCQIIKFKEVFCCFINF